MSDYIGCCPKCGKWTCDHVDARIAELEAEVERLSTGAHTCSKTCQRPVCLLRRERAKDREAMQAVAEYCHGLEGYPAGCDLRLLVDALAKRLEE